MDNPPAEAAHRRTPGLRLSVRFLMVLVLVLGGGFGWFVRRARVQREAVAAIVRAGGTVAYDESFLGDSSATNPHEPGWKEWLVDRFGIDYFESARSVAFSRTKPAPQQQVNDAMMANRGRASID